MIEILPIKLLSEEDSPIFGGLNVSLGKLSRLGFPVPVGLVVTAPEFKLKTALEHFDFGTKEIFEQSLTLVKKEVTSLPIPEILQKETQKHKSFLVTGHIVRSKKDLWQTLLNTWLEEIKSRLWKDGFYPGISQNLEPQIIIFIKKVESAGGAYFDPLQDDVVINIKSGKLHPNDQKKIVEIVKEANKKLFIPHEYEWILDNGLKLIGLKPYTPNPIMSSEVLSRSSFVKTDPIKTQSAVKIFLDLSKSMIVEENVDGIYIASEKIFDLNKPTESFENLVFKLVESALAFPQNPVFLKLADMSEGMGKVRGTLRLLHQKNLFDPITDALDFARHKKGLSNVHIVIPFIRGVSELLQIKRELAVKKLMRKNSLQIWMEVCTPENIINLEDYLIAGIDGVVLNLDELISYLNGFDVTQEEMTFYNNALVVSSFAYKKEVAGLLKFLEDALKLLHKSKVKFIATGSLCIYPQVLEFLVEKGVYGIVVEKYEAHSAKDLLYQTERRMILRKVI